MNDQLNLKPLVSAALVFAVVVAALGCFHVVPPGHRGVSVFLGKVTQKELPEGLTFKVPFVQQIIDYPVRQLKADGKAESFSSDLQSLVVTFAVMYRVPEQQVVNLFQEYRGDPYQNLIEPRIQEAIKQITAAFRAEDLVKDRERLKIESLAKLRLSIGDILKVEDLNIINIDLSDQLEQAIEQKVVREQEALAKNFELEKEKKQAEITIVRAKAEAESVRIKGEALKVSPEMIQFEIAQRWDGKTPSSVAVGQGGANILLPMR